MRRRIVVPGQASLFASEPAPPPRPERPPRVAHHCHVPGCDVSVPPRLLMCRRHWAMVPAETRRDVWKHFDPAQCATGPRPRPTDSWLRAARTAIDAVLDVLGNRVVDAIREAPRTLPALEDEPPAGLNHQTARIVAKRLLNAKRIRFVGDVLEVA